MNAATQSQSEARLARGRERSRAASKNSTRYFYSIAAMVMLIMALVGFHPFYFKGEGMAGRKISADLFPLVLVHGTFTTAWFVLFLTQALLIASRNRRLHMKLGWAAAGVALGITITGFMVAVRSVRPVPEIPFWGMAYRQFLLVMLTEIGLFALFSLGGVLARRRPERHRATMLLASLSILPGATVRMPFLFPIFGEGGSMGIFGPIFTLGAAFLLVRSLLIGAFDRWFAAGYVALVVLYTAAATFAISDGWTYLARTLFNT
jgi:hypothetical protein